MLSAQAILLFGTACVANRAPCPHGRGSLASPEHTSRRLFGQTPAGRFALATNAPGEGDGGKKRPRPGLRRPCLERCRSCDALEKRAYLFQMRLGLPFLPQRPRPEQALFVKGEKRDDCAARPCQLCRFCDRCVFARPRLLRRDGSIACSPPASRVAEYTQPIRVVDESDKKPEHGSASFISLRGMGRVPSANRDHWMLPTSPIGPAFGCEESEQSGVTAAKKLIRGARASVEQRWVEMTTTLMLMPDSSPWFE
ncbi:hypothetical protein B0J12DRAFT_697429 [Macrophomina phaseolina]|uniref:Uncharacterized protein n=1 Tax=Macrophomina phaseolina TaxID=35725 RepID=A0ABQ8GGP8_9PEZI|nr:hypothetical protein B0J12DRAFT_697429 [Macrophomina phaseolina]